MHEGEGFYLHVRTYGCRTLLHEDTPTNSVGKDRFWVEMTVGIFLI